MDESTFIQVILPLKLEWEPYYLVETPVVAGSRVKVEFAGKDYTAVVSAVGVTPPEHLVDKILYIKAIERELPPVFEQEIAFWRSLATYYLCTIGEVYKAALLRDRVAAELPKAASEAGREVQLSREQEQAAAAVRAAFGAGKTVLLHGVTGAGKTELYLQLARETLAEGKSVLFLVPEIALSRQLEDRVTAVFPGTLVYHSAKTWPRRAAVTKAVLEAPQYLVLGTRSALFLPHRNLGLIIVDEEHDNSFKQDSPAPRYHARESAIMLSLVQGAHVILGSATPSLESLYNAENGKFVKVDLKQRFHKGKEAEVLIVDTVAERRKNGMTGSLSLKLLKELSRTLEAGGQAVLLRSRRSYAPAVQCTECGTIPKCPHCNVSLSLHIHPERLVCHYCGHTEPYTGKCDHCGGALQPLGAGTQKIEEELQALYPRARIARLDSDATQAEARTIRQFAKGEIDVLPGRQYPGAAGLPGRRTRHPAPGTVPRPQRTAGHPRPFCHPDPGTKPSRLCPPGRTGRQHRPAPGRAQALWLSALYAPDPPDPERCQREAPELPGPGTGAEPATALCGPVYPHGGQDCRPVHPANPYHAATRQIPAGAEKTTAAGHQPV